MSNTVKQIFEDWLSEKGVEFSGVFSASGADGVLFQHIVKEMGTEETINIHYGGR